MTAAIVHGYDGYATHGCRCQVCRAAKAAYMRATRAEAARRRGEAQAAGLTYVVEDIGHGLGGYQNKGCRCRVCCREMKAARENVRRRAAMAVAS